MPSINFPFDTPSNYTYDSNKIEIIGGKAKLKLQQADLPFTETFDSDTGFTYDNTKAEFTGGKVQQKNKRPSGATFYASYNSNINGNWGNGVLTGTANGGASVSGGKLDLTGGILGKNVSYDPVNNANNAQTGCIRLRFTPNYSGAPATAQYLFSVDNVSTNNWLSIYHYTNGYIRGILHDSTGAVIGEALYYWITNVAGTQYEIEFNFDITTGDLRLFIDGTLVKYQGGKTGTRTTSLTNFYVGRFYNNAQPNFYLNDIIVFDSVQHTANYTPDWSNIYEYDYLENAVILPEMEHVGDGTIKLFNSFSTTRQGTPHFTLQIGRSGNYLYWTGSAWAVSDGSYTQSNDSDTFNAHCTTLPVAGEKYGQFKIIFPDSNTISDVDTLTANMNVDNGYVTTNPTIESISSFWHDELIEFLATITATGNDAVKFIIKKAGAWYYWNGSAWVESDGTYSQSNTYDEIDDNAESFTDVAVLTYVKMFLHSDDGTTYPEIDLLSINYDFAGDTPEEIHLTELWFDVFQTDADIATDTITIQLAKSVVKYKNRTMIAKEIHTLSIAEDGRVQIDIADTENMNEYSDGVEMYYILKIGSDKIYHLNIPETDEVNLFDSGVIVDQS